MRGVVSLLVASLVGCGRLGFEPLGDSGSDPDAAPIPRRWRTLIGKDAEPTSTSRVIEAGDGTLWVFGTSIALGMNYADPWFAQLDGETGAVIGGGIRNFAGSEEYLSNVVAVADGYVMVGGSYFGAESEQQVIGELALDGSWKSSTRMAGGLLDPGEYESFTDVRQTNDGSYIAVGFSQIGQGSCSTCKGIDALIVRFNTSGDVTFATTLGLSYGDESFFRMVKLPNDYIALGGGFGTHDYSGGAGTDIDSAPSFAARFTETAVPVWTRELRLPDSRGSGVRAAVFDPSVNEVVIGGYSYFGTWPFLAHMGLNGTIVRAREVILDDNKGSVTDIALAADGGLYVAGYEELAFGQRHLYVAKLDPSREIVEWARRSTLGDFDDDLDVVVASNGDLIVSGAGAGATGTYAFVTRIGADGSTPACSGMQPATVTLTPLVDNSVDILAVSSNPAGTPESQTAVATSLPGPVFATCSP